MAEFRENRRISYVIKMSCKVCDRTVHSTERTTRITFCSTRLGRNTDTYYVAYLGYIRDVTSSYKLGRVTHHVTGDMTRHVTIS